MPPGEKKCSRYSVAVFRWKRILLVWSTFMLMALPVYTYEGVRLVNRKQTVPNAGRVEIWNSSFSEWVTVCDNNWNFYDVQVTCRELGYPGAALVKLNSTFGDGESNLTVGNFVCRSSELTLSSCRHDKPFNISCSAGSAGAVCTAPGYVGCFRDRERNGIISAAIESFEDLSVKKCLGLCSEKSHRYAGVQNGTKCHCGARLDRGSERGNDRRCDVTCSGNGNQSCGGIEAIAIYDLELGFCQDPGTPDNGNRTIRQAIPELTFYFGTVIQFTCNPGFELDGAARTQCKLAGPGGAKVAWDSAIPACMGEF